MNDYNKYKYNKRTRAQVAQVRGDRVILHLLETLPFTNGGVDELCGAAGVHRQADVLWATAGAAVLLRPRQRQHCCHDNQLHPLPDALHAAATRGDRVSN